MKKIIALLIAFVMVFSLAGCKQKSNRDANTIYLDFEIVDNGYGYKWLNAACREFEELVKTKDYGGGKKPGVVCKVKTVEKLTDLQSMRRSGTEVFFGGGLASSLVRTGNLLDITDVVKEENYTNPKTGAKDVSIEDLMYEETLSLNKVGEKFYTIPTHEIYTGMTYDKDLFDKYGFYFADEDSADAVKFSCKVTNKDAYFVGEDGNMEIKTVGPDGEHNTYDDGMPSSLIELIQLYSYMKSVGVSPLQVPGKYLYEADFLVDGLYAALLGKDKARGTFDFTGEVDIVTSLIPKTNAFEGSNFGTSVFYKPNVITKTITEETGYYTTWSVERYYAMMFIEICKANGWFAKGHNPNVDTYTHQQAQYQFICSGYDNGGGFGPEVGTMSTGSYWYNESLNSFTNFDDFYAYNDTVEHRNLLWMPLPVNIFTSVTGEDKEVTTPINTKENTKGEKQTIAQAHCNNVYFNDNVRSDPQAYAALKDWIRFFHSYEQLEKTTIRQGFRKALKYEVRDLEDVQDPTERQELKQLMIDSAWMGFNSDGTVAWDGFYKQLSSYVDNSYLFRYASNTATFMGNQASNSIFKRGEQSRVCSGPNKQYLAELFDKTAGYQTAMHAFETTMVDFDDWKDIYKGTTPKTSLAPLTHNGQPIIYQSRLGEVVGL